jgi:hypothetical protein
MVQLALRETGEMSFVPLMVTPGPCPPFLLEIKIRSQSAIGL